MFCDNFLEFLGVNELFDFIETIKILGGWSGEKFKKEGEDGYSDFSVVVLGWADVIFSEEGPEINFVHGVFFIQSQVDFAFVVGESGFGFWETGVGLEAIIAQTHIVTIWDRKEDNKKLLE